ncbi:MAG: PAS domain S-box protein [Streptosporangiales bacterium]|nr:PAS domain S-box protein [Streptosporangiales bacterium]
MVLVTCRRCACATSDASARGCAGERPAGRVRIRPSLEVGYLGNVPLGPGREGAAAVAEHAIIEADTQGVIVRWSAGAEVLFGHRAEDAVGRTLDLVVPQRLREAHWTGFATPWRTPRSRTWPPTCRCSARTARRGTSPEGCSYSATASARPSVRWRSTRRPGAPGYARSAEHEARG